MPFCRLKCSSLYAFCRSWELLVAIETCHEVNFINVSFIQIFFPFIQTCYALTKEPLSRTNWSNKVIATVSQLWPQSVRFIQVWKTLWEMIIFIYSIKWKSDKNWWPLLMQWACRVLKPYSRRKPEEAWLCFSVIYFKSDFNFPTSTFQDCKWVEGLTWPVWYRCISLIRLSNI